MRIRASLTRMLATACVVLHLAAVTCWSGEYGEYKLGRKYRLAYGNNYIDPVGRQVALAPRVLVNQTSVREAVGSVSYLSSVGGAAFSGKAKFASAPVMNGLELSYHPERPDGQRLEVVVNGRNLVAHGLPDWQLVPVAHVANDGPDGYALVTLFGELEDGPEPPRGAQHIVNYNAHLKDTLLGLRLLQADMLLALDPEDAMWELPRDEKDEYILGSTEGLPDGERSREAALELAGFLDDADDFRSWLICDYNEDPKFGNVTFGWDSTQKKFTISGKPYWFFWDDDFELVRLPGIEPRLNRKVEPLTGLSLKVSNRSDLFSKANPAVYGSLETAMRYGNLFRLARENDPQMYRSFMASLAAARVPVVKTPVLVLDPRDEK